MTAHGLSICGREEIRTAESVCSPKFQDYGFRRWRVVRSNQAALPLSSRPAFGNAFRLGFPFRQFAVPPPPALWYHQRGPLEHTLFGPFRRLVLSCIEAKFCN